MRRANFMMFDPGHFHLQDEDMGFGSYGAPQQKEYAEGNEYLLYILSLPVTKIATYSGLPELHFSSGVRIEYSTSNMNSIFDYSSFARFGNLMDMRNKHNKTYWASKRASDFSKKRSSFNISSEAKRKLWKVHMRHVHKFGYDPVAELSDMKAGECESCGADIFLPVPDDYFSDTVLHCKSCEKKGRVLIFLPGNKVRLTK